MLCYSTGQKILYCCGNVSFVIVHTNARQWIYPDTVKSTPYVHILFI